MVPSQTEEKSPPKPRRRSVPEPLIDSDAAAAMIGVAPKTLQKYARQGLVRGVHVGKFWRFRASVIDEWISREFETGKFTGGNEMRWRPQPVPEKPGILWCARHFDVFTEMAPLNDAIREDR